MVIKRGPALFPPKNGYTVHALLRENPDGSTTVVGYVVCGPNGDEMNRWESLEAAVAEMESLSAELDDDGPSLSM